MSTTKEFNQAAETPQNISSEIYTILNLCTANKLKNSAETRYHFLASKNQLKNIVITQDNYLEKTHVKKILQESMHDLAKELMEAGARLEPQALEEDIFAKSFSGTDDKALVDNWVIRQKLSIPHDRYNPTFFDDLQTYQDYARAAINAELDTLFNGTTKKHPLLWHALSAGRLGHVMNLHQVAGRQFPIDFLLCGKTKHRVSPLQVLPYTDEPDIHSRLFSPENWAHKEDMFLELWDNKIPKNIKEIFPRHETYMAILEHSLRKGVPPANIPRRFGVK